jgi:hypothetical protein
LKIADANRHSQRHGRRPVDTGMTLVYLSLSTFKSSILAFLDRYRGSKSNCQMALFSSKQQLTVDFYCAPGLMEF